MAPAHLGGVYLGGCSSEGQNLEALLTEAHVCFVQQSVLPGDADVVGGFRACWQHNPGEISIYAAAPDYESDCWDRVRAVRSSFSEESVEADEKVSDGK